MTERLIFSEYLKFLDDKHKQIQNEMKEIISKIESLQDIPKTRENLLRQKFIAIQGNDKETLTKIESQLKQLPSNDEVKQRIEKLKEEFKKLEREFESTPFKVADGYVKPKIEFELSTGGTLKKSGNHYYYYPQGLDFADRNYEVIVDKGIPVKLRWIKMDSETYGHRLIFEQDLKLEPIEIPIETLVKEVRKEVIKEIPDVYTESIPITLPVKPYCPRCKKEYDITMLSRLVCIKCGRNWIDSYNVVKKQKLEEEKNTRKLRKILGIYKSGDIK